MRVDIVTIFPGIFREVFEWGVIRRAREKEKLDLRVHDLRGWTQDRHRSTDDTPYGGGPGMVMRVEPLVSAVESIVDERISSADRSIVLLSPRGEVLRQGIVDGLSCAKQLVLVAGRYEGTDERFVAATGAREISIGDYVLSGGEIPAMVLVEAVARLLPGAISDPESAEQDSFRRGLLDHPHYTRPADFRGLRVPQVLLSGNHAAIRRWRKKQAIRATRGRRPELLAAADLDDEELEIFGDLETEVTAR